MKDQTSIPTSKVARATQFIKTGAQIGGNYLKYNVKKMVNPAFTKDELHTDNASDIYNSLSQLKGSALKVAQMMSMERNVMPHQYSDKFSMAQYSAPPLSGPLVIRTFKQYLGKSPQELFDKFNMQASNAASIGQVHEAWKDSKHLAVKVQYPGVADSISSDLKMVRPMAVVLFSINNHDLDRYMGEVESKLLEETDYNLELTRSKEITKACSHIPNIFFPKYYPEYSSKRILTMDWLEGFHLKEFLKTNPSQEIRNQIGQALWDFYDFQIHSLKQVHADPHPGNFLMRENGTLGVIDFGCVKVIPEDFYHKNFLMLNEDNMADSKLVEKVFYEMEFLSESDTDKDKVMFTDLFTQMISLLSRPFTVNRFDFADDNYFEQIYLFAENLTQIEELRKSKVARGSQHSLYINRTYFGLYSILNELRAEVNTTKPDWLKSKKVRETELDVAI